MTEFDDSNMSGKACRPGKIWHTISVINCLFVLCTSAFSDVPDIRSLQTYDNNILDSGGVLLAEQAAYDVFYYDLDLFIDPADSSIHGSSMTYVHMLEDSDLFVLHLDTVFVIDRVLKIEADRSLPLEFTHKDGLLIARFPETSITGEQVVVEVSYYGHPRSATNPPWEGGFTWSETESGKPWIGVSCQINGADLWWPVKDHPSDRPDSVSLKFTVPKELVAVSNGKLRSVHSFNEETRTFHWIHRSPISNYAVSVNIGVYVELKSEYKSITGEVFPVYFWPLPENRGKAEELLVQIKQQLRFFENILGPYPFRHEKYGVVEAPFLGMEHQTIIAYGGGYQNDVIFNTETGFDDLHHHELSHEWWGNLVTASDWKDFWIHEGFATYMQALYAEHLHGNDQYLVFMEALFDLISNNIPIAPEQSRSTREMFVGRDIYMKGAWVLHTLRYLIGDENFFSVLRQMTYPDYNNESFSGKPLSRFVNTRDFIDVVEYVSGRDLEWFFETYLYYAELPELQKKWDGNRLTLSWFTSSELPFPMPVTVYNGIDWQTFIPDGKKSLTVHSREEFVLDPNHQVLRSGMFDL
ncbi:MAG: M1 family metallopeptidase [Balneolales bacterium]